MEVNNIHYRHILLYYFKKGKQAMEAHKKICRVYGDDALTERVCQKWFVKFRSGDFDVNDARLIQVSRPSIKIYPNRTPHQGQLSCMGVESAMFRVARDDAEKQICDKLKNKLDEFLELENYDWNLAEPQGHASGFITDLIAFLQSTFTCFNYLPDEVAQVACKSACSHIAKAILGILISEDVKQISMGALQQVNLDTIQCEQFAASEPVVGLPEGTLLQYFSQLRQLLDLFMSWDWPTYFHDYGHDSNKYDLVTPNMAVLLLEKLKESDKKTVFSVLKKSERDKKKLLETVLKQLRQLAQTTQQQ